MKKILSLLLTIASTAAFGQSDVGTSTSTTSSDRSPIGIYVGFDYMNLTDLHLKFSYTSADESYEDSAKKEGGTHLGMMGLTVGYNRTPERGIGFSVGNRLLQAINHSEYGNDKITMIIPEANLTWAANRFLTGYVGFNLAVWTGSKEIDKYDTQLGGQFGIGVRITKNMSVNSGYTIMNQTYKYKDEFGTSNADVQLSGFNTNFSYMF